LTITEVRTVARQIQQLEIYLNNLVSALTRGELPVNLQPITQIFDNAIESIPPVLNLQQDRFIELYNDLPNLCTAYAIDVTLSEESFIRQDRDITFYRFIRGNYWIIPTQSAPDKGWLVPNPIKGLSIERLPSLSAKIIEQLATKQQEILKFTTQLNEARDRSIQQEREINALKLQISSIGNNQGATTNNSIESKEILALKIDLEKLKAECQQRKRQQDKLDRDLTDRIQLLVAQEIASIQPASTQQIVETIDAEIVNLEPALQLNTAQNAIANQPQIDRILSPLAKLYNSGEKAFLRSYMVSTASLRRNDSQIIELVEDNIGHYWIVPFDRSTHYLVPKMDFPNYDKCFEILALLFDGANDSTNFILFKPAIVTTTKANMPKQWKLEQKGYLDPNLVIK
jgi:hypothetical protein